MTKSNRLILLMLLLMSVCSTGFSHAKSQTHDASKKESVVLTVDDVKIRRDLRVQSSYISRRMPFCSCDENYQPLPSCNEQNFKVTLLFTITADGKVTDTQVSSTSGKLVIDRHMKRALRRMLFYPIAQPVKAQKTIIYEHSPLKDNSCTKPPEDKSFEKP